MVFVSFFVFFLLSFFFFFFFFAFWLFGGRYKKFCLKIILIWISHGITIFNTKEGIIIIYVYQKQINQGIF